ncbi:hypothetical protein K1T71_010233 [Dendrolimus kikuchii]|uniref:Uncharacterized protein n=1 Tax=Dendrolimus kikuchii TaxID=765133 RepID=A0ACC1CS54_9NEOP|nr:hypothetical protein K1T71_010233 [Dendrolimus kikuchii]
MFERNVQKNTTMAKGFKLIFTLGLFIALLEIVSARNQYDAPNYNYGNYQERYARSLSNQDNYEAGFNSQYSQGYEQGYDAKYSGGFEGYGARYGGGK